MEYVFTFLEGIASFISPCLLPMLPIYIAYFAGKNEKKTQKAILNAVGFVLGFTTIFLLLAIFASQVGKLVSSYMKYIKIVFGMVIIAFGLNYMEFLNLKFMSKRNAVNADLQNLNFMKSFLFGMLFSISWTPCIGTFLSSALLLVAKQQQLLKGILLMLIYCIGLGIPFILSVALMEKLKGVFDKIKENFSKIKKISGAILIAMGIYIIFF